MAARSNAISEITRFWLEVVHGCLTQESIPVKVYRNNSDIDFLALKPNNQYFQLPNGDRIRGGAMVEVKDEHNFTKGNLLKKVNNSIKLMGVKEFIPLNKSIPKETRILSMFMEHHYRVAEQVFGKTKPIHRIFVFHEEIKDESAQKLRSKNIHFISIHDLLKQIEEWYRLKKTQEKTASLRFTFMGDLWELLFGHCECTLVSSREIDEWSKKHQLPKSAVVDLKTLIFNLK